ncbi:hypothetical protein JOC59_001719 [Weissella beninensis]|uniref:Uncharacterized protein n=1 Tax=Periweissella beninensis TaxID=504936 RepID=A0ABT0VHT4_9LACO|nr:hypothetical protein [Periweissella beninensis]MBM7544981.1 hypothetical protein [Periweissella beninensis]MCM2437221.1 hypothetical protein [Periweissella beninensis]
MFMVNLFKKIKQRRREIFSLWAVFAFFIILNSSIAFNDVNKETVTIYQTTQVKILATYRNGLIQSNGRAPMIYHLALPTGQKIRIHFSKMPTKKQIRHGKLTTQLADKTNFTNHQKLTLYNVKLIQGNIISQNIYVTSLKNAQAQKRLLLNTKSFTLVKIISEMLQYLLIDLLVVLLLSVIFFKENQPEETNQIIANTQAAYVQMPK